MLQTISGSDEGGYDVELLSKALSPSVWVLTSLGGVALIGIAIMIYYAWRGREYIGGVDRIERFPLRDALLLVLVFGTLDVALCSLIRKPTAGSILLVHGFLGAQAVLLIFMHQVSLSVWQTGIRRFGVFYRLLFFFIVRPVRLLLFILCIILVFAILYGMSGFLMPVTQPDSAAPGRTSLVSFETQGLAAFGPALYVSVVTLTTVGYADIRPSGSPLSLCASALEAVYGFFIMGYLVAVLASASVTRGRFVEKLGRFLDEKKSTRKSFRRTRRRGDGARMRRS